jgi:ubiquinone/menaquinone biosynthesis C-methylase UbiE
MQASARTDRHIRPARALATIVLAATLFGCGGSFKRFAYEGFDRDAWQHPDRVIEVLGIERGSRLADIGAGGGYFTFKLAEAVGPEGVVYAVDVDEDMIAYLEETAQEDGWTNVRVVRGEFGDPLLPDGGIDLVFTSNTYHHLEDPVAYFEVVLADLAPGGRVAILDLNEGPFFASDHFTPPEQIVRNMTAAGYERLESFDFIEAQSFQVFGPAEPPERESVPQTARAADPHRPAQPTARAPRS